MRSLLAERLNINPPLLAAAAIGVLALAGVAWQAWEWQGALVAPVSGGRHAPVSGGETVDPLPVILSANLFGAAAAQGGGAPAQATREATGYTLRAAFAGSGETAGAIIETSTGEADWYGIGDAVPGGVTLREVKPDHVILDRSGSLERLEFQRLSDLAVMTAPTAAPDGAAPAVQAGPTQPIPADASAEEKARIIRQRLEELRNRTRT